jgi:hypothetical protein
MVATLRQLRREVDDLQDAAARDDKKLPLAFLCPRAAARVYPHLRKQGYLI